LAWSVRERLSGRTTSFWIHETSISFPSPQRLQGGSVALAVAAGWVCAYGLASALFPPGQSLTGQARTGGQTARWEARAR
jgi:hypothetical protein